MHWEPDDSEHQSVASATFNTSTRTSASMQCHAAAILDPTTPVLNVVSPCPHWHHFRVSSLLHNASPLLS